MRTGTEKLRNLGATEIHMVDEARKESTTAHGVSAICSNVYPNG